MESGRRQTIAPDLELKGCDVLMKSYMQEEIDKAQVEIIASLGEARELAKLRFHHRTHVRAYATIGRRRWFRVQWYLHLDLYTTFNADGESEQMGVFATEDGRLFYRLRRGDFVQFTNKNTPPWTATYILYDLKQGFTSVVSY